MLRLSVAVLVEEERVEFPVVVRVVPDVRIVVHREERELALEGVGGALPLRIVILIEIDEQRDGAVAAEDSGSRPCSRACRDAIEVDVLEGRIEAAVAERVWHHGRPLRILRREVAELVEVDVERDGGGVDRDALG